MKFTMNDHFYDRKMTIFFKVLPNLAEFASGYKTKHCKTIKPLKEVEVPFKHGSLQILTVISQMCVVGPTTLFVC